MNATHDSTWPVLETLHGTARADASGQVALPMTSALRILGICMALLSGSGFFACCWGHWHGIHVLPRWFWGTGLLCLTSLALIVTGKRAWIVDFRQQVLTLRHQVFFFTWFTDAIPFASIAGFAIDREIRRLRRRNNVEVQSWPVFAVVLCTREGQTEHLTDFHKDYAYTCDRMAASLARATGTRFLPLRVHSELVLDQDEESGDYNFRYQDPPGGLEAWEDRMVAELKEAEFDAPETRWEKDPDEFAMDDQDTAGDMDEVPEDEMTLADQVDQLPFEEKQELIEEVILGGVQPPTGPRKKEILPYPESARIPLMWLGWTFAFLFFLTGLWTLHTPGWFGPMVICLVMALLSLLIWVTTEAYWTFDPMEQKIHFTWKALGIEFNREIGDFTAIGGFAVQCQHTSLRYGDIWCWRLVGSAEDGSILPLTHWDFGDFHRLDRLAARLAEITDAAYTPGQRTGELLTRFDDKRGNYILTYQ